MSPIDPKHKSFLTNAAHTSEKFGRHSMRYGKDMGVSGWWSTTFSGHKERKELELLKMCETIIKENEEGGNKLSQQQLKNLTTNAARLREDIRSPKLAGKASRLCRNVEQVYQRITTTKSDIQRNQKPESDIHAAFRVLENKKETLERLLGQAQRDGQEDQVKEIQNLLKEQEQLQKALERVSPETPLANLPTSIRDQFQTFQANLDEFVDKCQRPAHQPPASFPAEGEHGIAEPSLESRVSPPAAAEPRHSFPADSPPSPRIAREASSPFISEPPEASARSAPQLGDLAGRFAEFKNERDEDLITAKEYFTRWVVEKRDYSLAERLDQETPLFSDIVLADGSTINGSEAIGFLYLLIEESNLIAKGKPAALEALRLAVRDCTDPSIGNSQKLERLMAVHQQILEGPKKGTLENLFDRMNVPGVQIDESLRQQFVDLKEERRASLIKAEANFEAILVKRKNYALLEKLENPAFGEITLNDGSKINAKEAIGLLYVLITKSIPPGKMREAALSVLIKAIEECFTSEQSDDQKLGNLIKAVFLSDEFKLRHVCNKYRLDWGFMVSTYSILSEARRQRLMEAIKPQLNNLTTLSDIPSRITTELSKLLNEQLLQNEERSRNEESQRSHFQSGSSSREDEIKANLEVLGLDSTKTFTISDLERHVRKLSFQYQPDKQGGKTPEQKLIAEKNFK